jgi:small subunit ribosomal protein S15
MAVADIKTAEIVKDNARSANDTGRRRLLDYLKGKDLDRYRALIEKLGLRK